MMSGVPLETCWAFNKLCNNKFYYKAASCWYFYWVIHDARIHEYRSPLLVVNRHETTSQNTWDISNTAARTSNLALVFWILKHAVRIRPREGLPQTCNKLDLRAAKKRNALCRDPIQPTVRQRPTYQRRPRWTDVQDLGPKVMLLDFTPKAGFVYVSL